MASRKTVTEKIAEGAELTGADYVEYFVKLLWNRGEVYTPNYRVDGAVMRDLFVSRGIEQAEALGILEQFAAQYNARWAKPGYEEIKLRYLRLGWIYNACKQACALRVQQQAAAVAEISEVVF